MADPATLPAMVPAIQKAAQDFPLAANNIITANGFQLEEFSSLRERLQRSWFFRYRVNQELKQIDSTVESIPAPAATTDSR